MTEKVTREEMTEHLERNPGKEALESEDITNVTWAKSSKRRRVAIEDMMKPENFDGLDIYRKCKVLNQSRFEDDQYADIVGLKAATKHEHSGAIQVAPQLSDEDRKLLEGATEKIIDGIISKHLATIKSGS